MLDYIAVDQRRPGGLRADRRRPRPRRRAGRESRSPAASWPSSASWSAASTSPAPASAPSPWTRSSTAPRSQPGDAVIGLPSSGLHSNGYTLARSALPGIGLDDERLGRPLGEVLLEPTEIYVKPIVELLRSEVEVRGLAHITSGGHRQPAAAGGRGRLRDRRAAARAADLRADPGARRRLRRGDARGLQHGLRLLRRRPRRTTRRRRSSCCAATTRRRSGSAARRRRRAASRRPAWLTTEAWMHQPGRGRSLSRGRPRRGRRGRRSSEPVRRRARQYSQPVPALTFVSI